MITINCGFSRSVRKPHRKKRIECRNVTGIRIDFDFDNGDHAQLRKKLMNYAPEGIDWIISGYALVSEDKEASK